MKLQVLGPLEVERDGGVEQIAAHKTRTLLAMLALHANESVDVGRLADSLWPDDAPRTAHKTLQTYVLNIRKLLGDRSIETSAAGYRLVVGPAGSGSCTLDAAEFERLVDEGRACAEAGDHAAASARYRSALALWRGDAYPDLADVVSATADVHRLHELRLAAIEESVDVDLALGQHRVLVGRLERLIEEHPLRERLWGQLILALYRSGRQADALRAYQTLRTTLADELGIEPSPELQRLEHAVLVQDPAIGAGAGPLGPAAADVPVTRYARNGELHLAYQVFGSDDGPTILVFADWYSHIEALWEHPEPVRLLLGLAGIGRVVTFDPRGSGMSDPVDITERPTLEQWADDARAVLDAVGAARALVLGASAGASAAVMLAASHPDRVQGLVLFNPLPAFAAIMPATIGVEAMVELFRSRWGERPALDDVAPSLFDDDTLMTWFGRYQRLAGSPGRIATRLQMVAAIDVRELARTVRAPALVLHRAGNRICPVAEVEALAESMPDARFVALAGDDHLWFVGDFTELLTEVEAFAHEEHDELPVDRLLASLLVVELAGGTDPDLVGRFVPLVTRHAARFRGTVHEAGGGSIVCSFPGPSSALSCAHAAFVSAGGLGLDVRAGAHIGEIDRDAVVLTGPAATIARRVASRAAPGELLVTRTIVDLTAGSGVTLVERGTERFEGVPGDWPLFAVES